MDLVTIRSRLGLSQEALAEALKISRGHVGDMERTPPRRRITVKLAARIEETFKIEGVVDSVVADELKRARAA